MENRTADQWEDCFEGSFYDPHCFDGEKSAKEIEDKGTGLDVINFFFSNYYLLHSILDITNFDIVNFEI